MKKKEFIENSTKELIQEGRSPKEALAISFDKWKLNENSIVPALDDYLTVESDSFIDVKDFVNVIGRVKFRQFSNSADMKNFAKVYFKDFYKTFGRSINLNTWNYFSDRLEEYWLQNIYGK